jgi:hypothetical protein
MTIKANTLPFYSSLAIDQSDGILQNKKPRVLAGAFVASETSDNYLLYVYCHEFIKPDASGA